MIFVRFARPQGFVRCASWFRQMHILVSSKVNDLSGQINGATGYASGTHTVNDLSGQINGVTGNASGTHT
eukprot:1190474-Pleurochrysis_carterae.AAC.1